MPDVCMCPSADHTGKCPWCGARIFDHDHGGPDPGQLTAAWVSETDRLRTPCTRLRQIDGNSEHPPVMASCCCSCGMPVDYPDLAVPEEARRKWREDHYA